MNKGKVYIIGSGPGDIGLFTLKGKKCVEEADCIVYDRLIANEILGFAKEGAELIYLGKENTEGGLIQDEINNTIVEKALEGKIVARVKGGDPFVFGRGGEEIQSLVENGISFEVVPGITSSISVPAYAGIPVTHRGIARSFHVFTGHTMENGEWHDFEPIAKLDGTLVFLMGVKNLPKIVGGLVKFGKSMDTPVAIIEKGATSNQRVTTGTFTNIIDVAAARGVKSPAIIIIGEVVNFRDEFKWFEETLENNRRVLVTRDAVQAYELSKKVRGIGAEARELPLLNIESCLKDFDAEILKKYSVLLFNSPNGVKFFMENIKDLRALAGIKIGVVGSKTKEALENFKITPDFVPEKYMVSELARESVNFSKEGDKILVVTSDVSPCDEETWGKEYNRIYNKLTAYRTGKIKRSRKEMMNAVKDVDYITFLSSSTVESFWENMEGNLEGTENCKFVSIGPVTTETMKKYGMKVDLEAEVYDAQGVVEIIRGDLQCF